MATGGDSGCKDEVKTQFVTREGTYRLMALSEYSRPNRVGFTSAGGAAAGPVRVSLVSIPTAPPPSAATAAEPGGDDDSGDRICFNHGKELYVYVYRGIKKAADLTKPVDKKMYKGTNPTCHDFNAGAATVGSAPLLVGFSTGQVQLIDPYNKELSKLFNEERVCEKSRVTCVRWVPASSNSFIAAHAGGVILQYDVTLPPPHAAPHYAHPPAATGPGYQVAEHRARAGSGGRNPLRRWQLGSGACINELAWSPCGQRLATAGQDGFLRVFHYATCALEGRARSYFGGFLCVAWAPDGRLVAVGGEDDLVTLWSAAEKRVVARLQGHRSWVSAVAFDAFVAGDGAYRLGSVAQDTQLCLWDIAEDALRPPVRRHHASPGGVAPTPQQTELVNGTAAGDARRSKRDERGDGVGALTARLAAGLAFGERRGAGGARGGATGSLTNGAPPDADALRLMGTPLCPRFDEVPLLEPLVVKKIAHERLTALLFRADCFVTACADGCVYTWARPAARPNAPPAPPSANHNGHRHD